MNYILIPVLIALMIMVVVSLVRGIVAFLHGSKLDLESEGTTGATPNQLRQNKAMFARIKFQALAIVVVAVLLSMAR